MARARPRNLALLAAASVLGCNQLFGIESIEPSAPADTAVGDTASACGECTGPAWACVDSACVDRRFANGRLPESVMCEEVPSAEGHLRRQPATGHLWAQTLILGTTLANAEKACAQLSIAGHHNFHVATRVELLAIVDRFHEKPLRNSCTAGWQHEDISFSLCSSSPGDGPVIYCLDRAFAELPLLPTTKASLNFACVEVTRAAPPERFAHVGAHIVDAVTGLTWQADLRESALEWGDAGPIEKPMQESCGELGPGWRLPTIKELSTLIDERRPNPKIDTRLFPGPAFYAMVAADEYPRTPWAVAADGQVFDLTTERESGRIYVPPLKVRCVHEGPV